MCQGNGPFLGREGQDWTFLLKNVSLLGQLLVLKKFLRADLCKKSLARKLFSLLI